MDKLILQLQRVQISKQMAVASFVLYGFDILLTIDDEIKYIWKQRWTASKALYVMIRWPWFITTAFTLYSAVASPSPHPKFCSQIWNLEGFVGTLELGLVQYILALRTRALYAGNTPVRNMLMVLPILCTGAMITLNAVFVSHLRFSQNPAPGIIVGCFRNCINCELWYRLFYFPMILFDIIIFTLTVKKAWLHARTKVHAPVLAVLYRDGFMYFVAIFAGTLINAIIWNSGEDSLLEIMVFILRVMSAIMSCRLVLNLRGTVSCPLKEDSPARPPPEEPHPIAIVMNTFMGVNPHSNPGVNARGQSSTQGAGNVLHTLNQNETTHDGLASFTDPGATIDRRHHQDLEASHKDGGKEYSSRSMDTEEDDDDDDGAIIFHRPQFPPGAVLNGRETESVGSIPAVLKDRRASMKPN